MAWLRLAVLLGGAAVWLSATPKYVAGDLLWVSTDNSRIYDIALNATHTTGTATLIATGSHPQFGQMAFSADSATAYFTTWDGYVMAANAGTGQVTTFASGINQASGLLRTSSGKLLAASYADGKIFDITAGGNFSNATAWAYGLTNPRNLIETPNGIYVAEQGSNEITNVGNGGNLSSKLAFASVESPTALAWFNNTLYTIDNLRGNVYAVSGGTVNLSNYYAKGQIFASLTVGHGKLYAGTASGTMGVWDISTGGDYKTKASVVAGLPTGDSLLSVVPTAQVVETPPPPVAPVPEPGTLIAGIGLLTIGALSRRKM